MNRTIYFIAVLFLSGCASSPEEMTTPEPFEGDTLSFWDGDHLKGAPSIRISLSEQTATLYKGGQVAGVSRISSGREGMETVTGNFKIIEKDRHHRSSLFGDYVTSDGAMIRKDVDTSRDQKPEGAQYIGADMPYWMRIVHGTGMHEGFIPGYAASHGCIRMPSSMAEAFFRSVEIGTPVEITP